MKLFLFECKKLLKKKSIWIATLVSVLAMIGFYLFNHSVADNIHSMRMLDLETSQINLPEIIAADKASLEEAQKAEDNRRVQDLTFNIELHENMLEQKRFELENIQAGNWAAIHEKQYEDLHNSVEISRNQSFVTHIIEEQSVSMFTLRASAEEKRLLAESGAEPFIQRDTFSSFHPTIYDQFTGKVLEDWEYMTDRYGRSGVYFLYQMIPLYIIPFIILIGCFVFGNTVSSEATKKRKGLNLYAVQPKKKWTVYLAKFFAGMLFTGLFVLLILLVPVVTSLFTSGEGSLEYPVLIYDGPVENSFGLELEAEFLNPWTDEFHFITLGEYLNTVLLMTAALVVFLFSIYFLLSLFIKQPSINVALLLIGSFFGMTVFSKHPYNPFTYFDIHRVVNREFAVLEFNEAIHVTNGIIVLTVIGLIAIGVSYLRFRKYVVD